MRVLILALAIALLPKLAAAETIILTTTNTVTFRGEVSLESTTRMQLELTALEVLRGKADYPIYLVMDTPGGSIFAGENFIEFAKTIRNVKTITLFAASMGSAIVQGLPGERLVVDTGIYMYHRASGSFEGQFEDGELESSLEFWKSYVRVMEQRNADRLGLDLKTYKAKAKDEYWVRGKAAVAEKSADRVVSIKCSTSLINQEITEVSFSLFGPASVTYSGCPLLRAPIK